MCKLLILRDASLFFAADFTNGTVNDTSSEFQSLKQTERLLKLSPDIGLYIFINTFMFD